MAVKIRLQRHGKKGQPFYHIVIADARAARDGKFIEKIGTYNPLTNPATVVVNTERACIWLHNGAQPTDTVRSLLRFKGVLYRYHLLRGVEKGAFTQDVADKRYADFMEQKEKQMAEKVSKLNNEKIAHRKEALKYEEEVNQKKAQALAEKRAAAIEKQVEQAPAEESAENTSEASAQAE